jgi:hypothetical protein
MTKKTRKSKKARTSSARRRTMSQSSRISAASTNRSSSLAPASRRPIAVVENPVTTPKHVPVADEDVTDVPDFRVEPIFSPPRAVVHPDEAISPFLSPVKEVVSKTPRADAPAEVVDLTISPLTATKEKRVSPVTSESFPALPEISTSPVVIKPKKESSQPDPMRDSVDLSKRTAPAIFIDGDITVRVVGEPVSPFVGSASDSAIASPKSQTSNAWFPVSVPSPVAPVAMLTPMIPVMSSPAREPVPVLEEPVSSPRPMAAPPSSDATITPVTSMSTAGSQVQDDAGSSAPLLPPAAAPGSPLQSPQDWPLLPVPGATTSTATSHMTFRPISLDEATELLVGRRLVTVGRSKKEKPDVTQKQTFASRMLGLITCRQCFYPKLADSSLVEERDTQTILANTPVDVQVDVHRRILHTIYSFFTHDESPGLAMVGEHWASIGFVTSDPTTETNAGDARLLGMLMVLFLVEHFAQDAHRMEKNGWPFMSVAMHVAQCLVQSVRKGKLNVMFNESGSVLPVSCKLFVALILNFSQDWADRGLKVEDLQSAKMRINQVLNSAIRDKSLNVMLASVPHVE